MISWAANNENYVCKWCKFLCPVLSRIPIHALFDIETSIFLYWSYNGKENFAMSSVCFPQNMMLIQVPSFFLNTQCKNFPLRGGMGAYQQQVQLVPQK